MRKLQSLLILLSVAVSAQLMANTTLNLSVKGMHCGSCEKKFKTAAGGISGIVEVSAVSAESNNAVVVYDEKTTTSDKVIKALADKTGYTVSASNEATAVGKPTSCCMKGQKEAACSKKDKEKCTKKTKCTKTE
ncbi:MAG TPA: heavy-metal-associated domain-containing protein [Chitinophagales bacterium]|nr:heavy-metal-associated domain-containing protein [Chitinophagales bacterium]HNM32018.1 heavy-metal-associated domain-containing protein [Chitinophagales bacterium]